MQRRVVAARKRASAGDHNSPGYRAASHYPASNGSPWHTATGNDSAKHEEATASGNPTTGNATTRHATTSNPTTGNPAARNATSSSHFHPITVVPIYFRSSTDDHGAW